MTKVLATGTFDILHSGHLDYLEYAKSLGDYLVVHIESDEAVKRHKGAGRPVNDENSRERIISGLKIVDETLIADGEKEATQILKSVQPDIMVIAPKDSFDLEAKEAEFKSAYPKLQVVWFNKTDQKSSSSILNKIKEEL
jgi:D-beta-D-heptose 7-phosphate kinase/D-beta-D-heptose 1-phosphate adenosyltransferase